MRTILFPSDLFDQSSDTFSYLHLMARAWQARVCPSGNAAPYFAPSAQLAYL